MPRLRAELVLTALLAGGAALGHVGWGLSTASTVAAGRLTHSQPGDVDALLLGAAGLGLLGAGAWLGVVSLVGIADLVGRSTVPCAGVLRPAWVRSVLLRAGGPALGVAVICAGSPVAADPGGDPVGDPAAHPAGAAAGSGVHGLIGLSLPSRPVSRATPEAVRDVVRVVRPGECLWSITRDVLGDRASTARVAHEWQRLYRANRDRVGPDPDVVPVGARLRVPAPLTHQPPSR